MSNIITQKSSFLIITFTLLLIACDAKPPIPEQKFINVYVDLLIIQDTSTVSNFSLDSVKILIFERHRITSGQYDETLNYYNSNPEKWLAFFDSVSAYVEDLKKANEN